MALESIASAFDLIKGTGGGMAKKKKLKQVVEF